MIQLGPHPLGSQKTYQVTLNDSNGSPISGVFTGAESLVAHLWPGRGLPTIASPAVSWLLPAGTATTGATLALTIGPADLVGLEVGTYRLQILINPGSDNLVALDCTLALSSAPGTGTAKPAYGCYQDMLDECPWLPRLQSADADSEGFTLERGKARQWLDGLILRAAPASVAWSGSGGGFNQLGYIQSWGGGSLVASRWLKEQLEGNKLIVAGPIGEPVVRAVSLYASALACGKQLGQGGKASEWERRGIQLRQQAFVLVSQMTVELTLTGRIDAFGDPLGDVAISLGTTNTRYT